MMTENDEKTEDAVREKQELFEHMLEKLTSDRTEFSLLVRLQKELQDLAVGKALKERERQYGAGEPDVSGAAE